MAIKQFKPTSPSRRGASVVSYKELDKVAPLKSLLGHIKKHGGRNNTGRITVRHQGGGVKDTTVWLISKERSVKLKVR